uniref:Uncharacterized protein n=1 Tax=Cannabis sativa TaxID=3483 RepID=A0A803NTM7_CANSA
MIMIGMLTVVTNHVAQGMEKFDSKIPYYGLEALTIGMVETPHHPCCDICYYGDSEKEIGKMLLHKRLKSGGGGGLLYKRIGY